MILSARKGADKNRLTALPKPLQNEGRRTKAEGRNLFLAGRNVISIVDGHVSHLKIFWNGVPGGDGFPVKYEPPAGYDYKWSGN